MTDPTSDRRALVRKAARRLPAGMRRGPFAELRDLRRRVADLEEEAQEARRLNLRVAELVDVVEELLVPMAARDEKRTAEALEKFSRGV